MEEKLHRRRIRNSIVVDNGAALQMEEKLHQTISLTIDAAIMRIWWSQKLQEHTHTHTLSPSLIIQARDWGLVCRTIVVD
ncbi:hypothetical protein LWI28_012567 [Acer negundo]|uniref:Uncharacterized protein n=1 Tax=Acer negundo TaxID=4023 RepID=A0AAD5P2X9_ACENE|nr:hypothetical protein LWI28_012567 [Acer negundo]